VGDPESGSKRRAIEIDGAFERGMVEVKIKDPADPKSRAKLTPVPATADNLRLALRQALEGKPRKPESIAAKTALVARLRAQLDAATDGPDVMNAPSSAHGVHGTSKALNPATSGKRADTSLRTTGQRGEGRIDGVAMVQGANMSCKAEPRRRNRKTGEMEISGRGTMGEPLGSDRVDPSIIREKMHGGTHGYLTRAAYDLLSRSQQRTYWSNVAKFRARAERAKAYEARRPVTQARPLDRGHVGHHDLNNATERKTLKARLPEIAATEALMRRP
jgi:hypothetical protein